MQAVVMVILLIVTVAMIALILIQKSEGGGLGGSQMSGVMTARGSQTLLTQATGWLAAIFLALALLLAYLAKTPAQAPSLGDAAAKLSAEQPAKPATPTVPMAQ